MHKLTAAAIGLVLAAGLLVAAASLYLTCKTEIEQQNSKVGPHKVFSPEEL
jgi:hypothetical protein